LTPQGWRRSFFQVHKFNQGGMMNKAVGAALVAVGVILVIYGISASESFSSDVSRFFTGSPTDRTIWLFVGGAAALVVGLVLMFQRSRVP
jgi:hypothetical protein